VTALHLLNRHAVGIMAAVGIILVEQVQDVWAAIGITFLTVGAMLAHLFFSLKECEDEDDSEEG
jgi:hypothetical protein